MGATNNRRTAFFANHPVCIYCGGDTPAVEIDHVPSRQLFVGRQWPEGFEFPTCNPCNRATARAEQNIAMLSRIYPAPPSENTIEHREMRELLEKVAKWDVAFLEELRPSSRFVRRALRKRGLSIPRGMTTRDIPILNVSGPLVERNLAIFSRKLLLALHYKETGNIISRTGAIGWRWYSNEQKVSGKLPEEFLAKFSQVREMKRSNRDISDQFSYIVFGPTVGGRMAAYFAAFRFSFAILGVVSHNLSDIQGVVPDEDILQPLAPHEPQ